MNDVGWAWWLVMMIGMVAFWGLLVYAIVLLVRGSAADDDRGEPESPETVLKRRLAAGEISVDEYDELQEKLGGSARAPAGVG